MALKLISVKTPRNWAIDYTWWGFSLYFIAILAFFAFLAWLLKQSSEVTTFAIIIVFLLLLARIGSYTEKLNKANKEIQSLERDRQFLSEQLKKLEKEVKIVKEVATIVVKSKSK